MLIIGAVLAVFLMAMNSSVSAVNGQVRMEEIENNMINKADSFLEKMHNFFQEDAFIFKTTDLEDHYTIVERIIAGFLAILSEVGCMFVFLYFLFSRGIELSGGLVTSEGLNLFKSAIYLIVGAAFDAFCKVPMVLGMVALSGSRAYVEKLKSSFDELYYQWGLKY